MCPQENQCEGNCILGKKDKPVAIGNLERFTADWARAEKDLPLPPLAPKTGKKVAVVGSGPGSLTVAGDLIRKGHEVTVYEAFHKAGGVLVYGIPEFRLPKEIVASEVNFLERLGVKVECNTVVGSTITVDELLEEEGFDAIYLGVGAGLPKFVGVPGENLIGVYSANEYLTRANLMKGYLFPEYDTPPDQGRARVRVRRGQRGHGTACAPPCAWAATTSSASTAAPRPSCPPAARRSTTPRTRASSSSCCTPPLRFIGDEDDRLKAVELQEMKLGEPDESGRRRPEPIPGSVKTIDCDLAIIAIGSGANPLITSHHRLAWR